MIIIYLKDIIQIFLLFFEKLYHYSYIRFNIKYIIIFSFYIFYLNNHIMCLIAFLEKND